MRKKYYPLLFLVLIFVVCSQKIINSDGLIVYGDFLSTLSVERFINTMYPLWDEYGSFPNFEQLPRIIYRYPLYLLTKFFGISTYSYFKILFLGTPILAGILMYLVTFDIIFDNREDIKKILGAFLSATFYMLNPWAVQRMHQQAFLIGYAITPLVFWGIYKSVHLRKFVYYFVTAVALVFSAMTPHYFVFNTIVVMLFILIEIFSNKRPLLEIAKIVAIIYGLFFLLSSYWLIPLILSSLKAPVSPGYAPSLEIINVLSRNSDILNVIRLLSAWYIRTPYKPDNQILAFAWSIISVLLFAGILAACLIAKREKKNLCIFTYVLAVIIMFLGMGTKGMLPEFYKWLVFGTPYGWVFRGANKWIGLLAFCYSIMISFLFYYVSSDKRRIFSISFVFLLMFAFYSAPNNYGFFTKVYLPADIPREFYQMFEEISDKERALYFTLAHPFNIRLYDWGGIAVLDTLSSPIPTFSSFSPYANPFLEFLYFQLLENRTEHFADYLSFLGVDTFVYHNRIINELIYPNFPGAKQNEERAEVEGAILDSFFLQKGLHFSDRVGEVYIFENKLPAPRMYVPNLTVLISDDMQMIESLTYITGTKTVGVLFNDLQMNVNQLDYADYIVLNPQNPQMDFIPLYSPIVIAPAKFTNEHSLKIWSRGYFNDPSYGEWHLGPLKALGIRNWQFDYGLGFSYTNGKMQNLTVKFNIKDEGDYVILVRYFENTFGGSLRFRIGARYYHISTKSDKNMFVWENLGDIYLNRGNHEITITNIEGFNAINVIVLVPKEIYQDIISQINEKIYSKGILYLIEAEKLSPLKAVRESGASNGEALKTFNLLMPLDIVKDSNYTLAVRYRSCTPFNMSIEIGNVSYSLTKLESTNWTWISVKNIHLPIGKYNVRLNISADVLNLLSNPSFEKSYNGRILDWRYSSKYFEVSLSNDAVDGNYSLKISTNLTTPFRWSWIRSDEINVSPGESYLILFKVKYQNVNATHVKIEGFNKTSKKWESLEFVARGIGGISDGWKEYSKIVTIPNGITKIRIVLNAGWVLDANRGSAEVYFDDIRVYDVSRIPSIDLILIQEKPIQENNPARIISYKKINSTLWEVRINATKPFMLVFTEAYNSLWEAKIYKDDKLVEKVSPVPVYGVINGFWIYQSGELKVVLEYIPQDFFKWGLIVSLITFVLSSIVCIVYDWRRKEKIEK